MKHKYGCSASELVDHWVEEKINHSVFFQNM